MARYRQFLCAFWDDPDVEDYTSNQKLVFVCLFTNKNTTESGIYPITPKRISQLTGLKKNTVESVLKKLKNIIYDWDNRCVFVVNFLRHNRRGNPELIIKSIINDIETIKTPLWNEFKKEYPLYFERILNIDKSLINILESNTHVFNRDEYRNRDIIKEGKSSGFKKPSIKEIRQYCIERKNNIDPVQFFNFYKAKGWMIGKNKMIDWKASVITWEKNSKQLKSEPEPITVSAAISLIQRNQTTSTMEEILNRLPEKDLSEFMTFANKDNYLKGLCQRAKKILAKGKK